MWKEQQPYYLYEEASMLWEWHPKLKDVADERGVHFFSRPFDNSVVDCLRTLGVGAHRERNVRSIRHGYGLNTRQVEQITGRLGVSDIGHGVPLDWGLVAG